jgi:Toprim-like
LRGGNGVYTMKRRDITEFLRELTGRRIQTKVINGWVSISCPLATWTHQTGHDENPSFGVKIRDDGEISIFNCLTCKKKGTLSHLARLYGNYSGRDVDHLIDEAEDLELLGPQLPLWDDLGMTEVDLRPPTPLGAELEDIFEPAYARNRAGCYWVHPYLERRGISYGAARWMDLRIDEDDGHGVERIIFSVRGFGGPLYGYTGRATDDTVNPRIRDYYGLPKRACLLGADRIGKRVLPIVLCEGLFDYAMLVTCGYMAVAAMHSGLTELQAQILRDIGRPVILMYDNDDAGRSGHRQAKRLLGDHIPLQKVRYPKGNMNDPGALSRERIDWMLKNSRVA